LTCAPQLFNAGVNGVTHSLLKQQTPPARSTGGWCAAFVSFYGAYRVQDALIITNFRSGGYLDPWKHAKGNSVKDFATFWKAMGPQACATVGAIFGSVYIAGGARTIGDWALE
jgi:hypothetical protein